MKAKVRELWNARQSLTSEQLRDQWQRYIRGWWNYFLQRYGLIIPWIPTPACK